jgi:formylglycine-generating enzyme required for sulfatase activity
MENNATVQMPPLRPAAQAPPPGAAENMPTMQMGMSTPISRPLAGAPPPPVEDLPTMPMGVSLPSSSKPPEKSPPLQEMGEMKTMAMPAFQPPPPAAMPPYAPPPAPGGYPAAPDFPAPVETSRRASNLPRLALFGGGALLLVVLVVVAIIVFGGSDTPLAGAKISETPTATDAPQLTATARPSSTSAPTTTPVPSETPIPTPVPTATPLPATIVQQDAEMILIPASAFAMGCDATNIHEVCSEIEEPVHSVKLDAYYIDKYEVTNAQYKACVAAGACQPPQEVFSFIRSDYYTNAQFDNYPVIYVTWQDANQFCSWRGGRLPSEAEWEKAARGNIDQRVYPWGNTAPSCALANFNPGEHCKRDPNAVGSYPEGASLFGVMDMSGNVSEWVADWFLFNYYQSSPAENPTGPNSGTSRVLRGGSWTNNLNKLQVSNRDNLEPGIASNNIGFRCVLTP